MPDQAKVIKGLENCTAWNGLHQCQPKYYGYDCPYDDEADCKFKLMCDALELLKEQEPKTGHWIFESQYCEAWSHTCSECGKRMTTAVNMFANWCWNCGAKMEGQ